jgi:MATE family multidrug resistance protein
VLVMACFVFVFIFFIGFQGAAGVLIARFYGANEKAEIANTLNQAIYLALFLTIPATFLLWYLPEGLIKVGENPAVVALTRQYFHAMVWCLPALSLFFALRDFVSALSYTRIIFGLSLLNIPLAILFNYLFIFGHGGFAAMGMAGLGYSTAVVEWICALGLLAYILRHPNLTIYVKFYPLPHLDWPRLKEILHLGWPVSINMGFEWGMFSVTTLMMGHLGVLPLAAHQIALQLATLAFMLPLGISQGTAILVGQSLGAKNLLQAKHFVWANVVLGLSLAAVTAILFLCFSKFIISWFIDVHDFENRHLVIVASTYLKVMALFQLLDALQVIMTGALRGLKDTFVPMVLGLVSYWLVGLLSGYCFAFVLGFHGVGLWWGLGVGIGVSGIILLLRFLYRIKAEERRVFINCVSNVTI